MSRFILLLVPLFLFSCSEKISSLWLSSTDSIEELRKEKIHNCNDPAYYAPDSMSPMRYIRVNVHFMDDSSQSNNFDLQEGKKFMKALIKNANERLANNIKMNLPPDNNTEVLPSRYRYIITGAKDGDDGFYKHLDNELYYFVNKGRNKNNYDRSVINKYAISPDSILNIFLLPHHPDSISSPSYKVHRTGIALGTSLKMSGVFEKKDPPWKFATLLNHEVGHILGLSHSWVKHDRCDDTPPHPNCWDDQGEAPCDQHFSNNMMDYNASQMALTPCQLGIIHKGFNKESSKTRKLLEKDWCQLDDSKDILIEEETHWLGSKDIRHDIIVENGAELHIYCRIAMPAGSFIRLKPGARLILHEAMLHNDCGQEWKGIEIQSSASSTAKILSYGNSRILNTASVQ